MRCIRRKKQKTQQRSKPIAVILPVKGAGVNNSDQGNRYGGLQLTRERLQFSGDSENTHEESTNNKEPANKGTPLSPAENQTFHVKEPAESDEKGCQQNGYTHQIDNERVQTERLQSSPEKKREEGRLVNQDDNQLSLTKYQDIDVEDNGKSTYMIDWYEVILALYKILPPTKWEFFAIHLFQKCQRVKTFNVHNKVTEIERDARNKLTEGWVQAAYLMVFNKWKTIMGNEANFEQIEDVIKETIDDKSVMDTFLSIKRFITIVVKGPIL
ncbi:uncharacterized protein LOC128551577 [Mercenaria mercenaria]|uniref:uncharacterized protein LOC128551577 n=1 Tax=Mercenaria mercenaria TaxID=6596 RepID=UPI00234F1067|nr:uncharacterized protein LOC128551577 [Mercenaria mercenaria]